MSQVQSGGSRWCLSGTPVQNDSREIFSYLHFLRQPPYNNQDRFEKIFKDNRPPDVLRMLGAILKPLMLRRNKHSKIDEEPILALPPR